MRVELLVAGWTTHPGEVARRGAGWASVRFPSLVVLVHHPDGVVLYDTGYAPRVQRALRRGIDRIYGALLPVHVTPAESLLTQLAARGIAPGAVTHVVISHLHADHVGGLRDLPAARVVASRAAIARMRTIRGFPRLVRGWLPALLPDNLEARLVDPSSLPPAPGSDLDPLDGGRDLCGDGSLVVVPLPGHSPDHLGLLVRTGGLDLLAVGDAVWHRRAVTHGELPHPVTRLITRDWHGYRLTAEAIGALAVRRPDLVVLPSHDQDAIDEVRALLTTAPDPDPNPDPDPDPDPDPPRLARPAREGPGSRAEHASRPRPSTGDGDQEDDA